MDKRKKVVIVTKDEAVKIIEDACWWYHKKGCTGLTQAEIFEARDIAISALSQEPCDDAEQIDYHDDFETASRKIHDYEERQKQNDKKCGSYNNTNTFKSCCDCKLIGTDSCYMVCGGSKSLYKPKQKLEPCDECRNKRTSFCGNCKDYDEFEQEPKYCDRNICISNEYNGIGCDECEVTKSQEPCTDAVSRQAVIDIVNNPLNIRLNEIIKNLPSVTQKLGKWIPVSERLPEDAYGCLVTVYDTDLRTQDEFENILPYFVGYDGETWNDADGEPIPFEVVAWMKLPQPYKRRECE